MADLVEKIRGLFAGARNGIADIDEQIRRLNARREAVQKALPHSEDLADWLCRNIDRHADGYEARVASMLNKRNIDRRGWEEVDATWDLGFNLFKPPSASEPKEYLTTRDEVGFWIDPIDARGIVWLLRSELKARARETVLRLLPHTATGLRRAERDRELQRIDDELAVLHARRSRIAEALREAAAAAGQ